MHAVLCTASDARSTVHNYSPICDDSLTCPGCVAPCSQLVMYGRCREEGCTYSHETLPPDIATALRGYFIHLEDIQNEQQQQVQKQQGQQAGSLQSQQQQQQQPA